MLLSASKILEVREWDWEFSWYENSIAHPTIHEGIKPYKYSHCDGQFSLECSLKKHIKLIHEDEKPFGCSFCSLKFALKVSFMWFLPVFLGNIGNYFGVWEHKSAFHLLLIALAWLDRADDKIVISDTSLKYPRLDRK